MLRQNDILKLNNNFTACSHMTEVCITEYKNMFRRHVGILVLYIMVRQSEQIKVTNVYFLNSNTHLFFASSTYNPSDPFSCSIGF